MSERYNTLAFDIAKTVLSPLSTSAFVTVSKFVPSGKRITKSTNGNAFFFALVNFDSPVRLFVKGVYKMFLTEQVSPERYPLFTELVLVNCAVFAHWD